MKKIALYMHVPFCIKKCPYCDFYSIPVVPSYQEEDLFLEALKKELNFLKKYLEKNLSLKNFTFYTFYAGGGTPSLLSPRFYFRLFNFLYQNFHFTPVELTLEANPETLNKEKTRAYLETGFNRISIGIQSFFNKGLKFLGRIHDAKKALKAIEFAQKAGFEKISIDLIFGWKGQGEKTLKKEILKAISLEIPHISIYELTIEPFTPFYKKFKKKTWLSDKKLLFYYELIEKTFKEKGYNHYEISNYALKGFECIHNLFYWKVQPYLGIGPSAVSRILHLRWENPRDLRNYYYLLECNKLPLKIIEKMSEKDFAKEKIMMELRLEEGLDIEELLKYRVKIQETALLNLEKEGLIKRKNRKIKLTLKGMLIHNQVVSYLWDNLEELSKR